MEEREFKTLNPPDSLTPFPPHRRRPLRSQTYDTLFRILSHCNVESHRSRTTQLVPDDPKQGSGLDELGKDVEQQVHDELTGPATLGSVNLLIEKAFEGSEVIGNRDGGFKQAPMKIDEVEEANRIERNEELIDNDGIDFVKTFKEKKDGNVLESNNQEDQICPLEVCMEESGNAGQLEIDKEQHSCSVTEALDTSLDIDIDRIAECLIPQVNSEEKNSFVERTELEEVEHEMEHKYIELEKSLSTCTVINHPLSVASDDDVEEGEISGDIGICDQSSDLLLEGDVSSELKKVVEEPIFKDISNKEEFVSREQKDAYENDKKSNINLSGLEVELIGSSRAVMDYKSEMVFPWQTIEANQSNGAKESGRAIASPGNLSLPSKLLGENVTQNEGGMYYDKDDGICKKRKRGPGTNERRRKKKLKERAKRAEKNRKLGIKRLKLQPVLKPKTITYCRHYLRGRCQEGDKCKFSHDTIPLTKSVACCHFARHSCMKGDDCPFDHELSKYPCDNYVSKGSCSRGADCMFSHDMPQKEDGSPMASNVSKPGLTSSSLHGNSNSNSKNTEQNVAETSLKPAAQRTIGKNIVSFEKLSLGNASQRSQPGSSVKENNGVIVGPEKVNSALDIVGNSKYITKRTSGVAPRGINFLSFGKAPLDDDLSSKDSSRFPSNKDYNIGKSVFGGSSTDIQAGSSPKRGDRFKVDNQVGQSASDSVLYLNEMPKGSPSEACPRLNFLSYGKAPITDSSSDNQASSTSGQSLDQLADGHGKCNPSSMQKLLFSNTLNSSQKTLLSNAPSSAQKALLSTLAFAAKHESEIKMGRFNSGPAVSTNFNKETGSSQVKPMEASKILDFLYGGGNKSKQ